MKIKAYLLSLPAEMENVGFLQAEKVKTFGFNKRFNQYQCSTHSSRVRTSLTQPTININSHSHSQTWIRKLTPTIVQIMRRNHLKEVVLLKITARSKSFHFPATCANEPSPRPITWPGTRGSSTRRANSIAIFAARTLEILPS